MDNKRYINHCPETGKLKCTCDEKLQICQDHRKGLSHNTKSAFSKSEGLINHRANQAIFTLNTLNAKVLTEGKGMFKELCNKLCNVMDEISKRQQCIADLSTHSNSLEIEEKIEELEKLNISLRDKSDFKKLLDKYMSPEENIFESSSLEDFKKDFRNIVSSLSKSNEILQIISNSSQAEQNLIKQLEIRIENSEKETKKIKNFEQRLQKMEKISETHLKDIESTARDMARSRARLENSENFLKEKLSEVQRQGRQQIDQIQAHENLIRLSAEENAKILNANYMKLHNKVAEIEKINNESFRQALERMLDEAINYKIANEKINDAEVERESRDKAKANEGGVEGDKVQNEFGCSEKSN